MYTVYIIYHKVSKNALFKVINSIFTKMKKYRFLIKVIIFINNNSLLEDSKLQSENQLILTFI